VGFADAVEALLVLGVAAGGRQTQRVRQGESDLAEHGGGFGIGDESLVGREDQLRELSRSLDRLVEVVGADQIVDTVAGLARPARLDAELLVLLDRAAAPEGRCREQEIELGLAICWKHRQRSRIRAPLELGEHAPVLVVVEREGPERLQHASGLRIEYAAQHCVRLRRVQTDLVRDSGSGREHVAGRPREGESADEVGARACAVLLRVVGREPDGERVRRLDEILETCAPVVLLGGAVRQIAVVLHDVGREAQRRAVTERDVHRALRLDGGEVAEARDELGGVFAEHRAGGNHVDRATGRVAAIERALGPFEHLDAGQIVEEPAARGRSTDVDAVGVEGDRRIAVGIRGEVADAPHEVGLIRAAGFLADECRNQVRELVRARDTRPDQGIGVDDGHGDRSALHVLLDALRRHHNLAERDDLLVFRALARCLLRDDRRRMQQTQNHGRSGQHIRCLHFSLPPSRLDRCRARRCCALIRRIRAAESPKNRRGPYAGKIDSRDSIHRRARCSAGATPVPAGA